MKHLVLFAPSIALLLSASPVGAQSRVDTPVEETVRRIDRLDAAAEDSLRDTGVARVLARDEFRGLPILANSHLLGGEPVSIGPDWKAAYGPEGVTFTPALGRHAPQTRSLQFQLEEVRVGETVLAGLDLDAQPQLDAKRVVYTRSESVSEVYDALPEGLEQSFVFDTLPAVTGDLVVSGRLSTDLLERATGDSGALRFEEPGFGTIRIDRVVGFDASGRSVAGSLRSIGERLEIVLPGEFVATAEFPLVLDPLFGSEFQATASTVDASQSDVSFGESDFDEYAVVYSRFYSETDIDITALSVNETGPFGLLPVAIENTVGTFDQEPSIAFNIGAKSWAVAWQRAASPGAANEVLFTTFEVAGGVVQPRITIGAGEAPDVGGEFLTGFSRVVVAWDDLSGINVSSITVSETATPVLGTTTALSTVASDHEPAISKSGGSPGVYGVAWTRAFSADRDIRFQAVNDFAGALGSLSSVTSIGPDEAAPDIDGDGLDYLLVFGREEVAGNGDSDIVARKLKRDVGTNELVLDPIEILVEADTFDDEELPAVAQSGNEFVVAWLDQFSGSAAYDVYYASVSNFDCIVCEPATLVSTATETYTGVEIGARQAGGDASGTRAMIAYDRSNSSAKQRGLLPRLGGDQRERAGRHRWWMRSRQQSPSHG